MNNEFSKDEILIMGILKEVGLAGSTTIALVLQSKGIHVSESKIGRLLLSLDKRNITKKYTNKGRILTNEGKKILRKNLAFKILNSSMSKIVKSFTENCKSDIIKVLEARRAIEKEAVRLATIRATPKDIKRIEKYLDKFTAAIEKGGSAFKENQEFHFAIATACKNNILKSCLELTQEDKRIAELITFIRRQKINYYSGEHLDIFNAIKSKNVDAAEKALVNHINKLIKDVEIYWSDCYKK